MNFRPIHYCVNFLSDCRIVDTLIMFLKSTPYNHLQFVLKRVTLKPFQNCYFHLQDLFGLLCRLHFQSHTDLVHLVRDFINLTKTTPANLLQLDNKANLNEWQRKPNPNNFLNFYNSSAQHRYHNFHRHKIIPFKLVRNYFQMLCHTVNCQHAVAFLCSCQHLQCIRWLRQKFFMWNSDYQNSLIHLLTLTVLFSPSALLA